MGRKILDLVGNQYGRLTVLGYRTLQHRINIYGWSIEKAFTTPIRYKGVK